MKRRNILLLSSLPFANFSLGSEVPKAKNIIHLYLPGGIAAQEYLDPKPHAPSEYRGPFSAIKTNVPGIEVSEMFPNLALQADKYTIIRSTNHGEAAHERGTHSINTGYRPSPALIYPSMGSVVSLELGNQKNLPAYVSVPSIMQYGGSGFLSSQFNPFSLGSDPASANFKVQDLQIGIGDDRFERRKNLLETIDQKFAAEIKSDNVDAIHSFYDQAYSLIQSESAKNAFDISKEKESVKEKYGKNQAGQRLLMARRLVENGVRYVQATFGGWDMHSNIKEGFQRQAPELDQALGFLFNDLYDRGMLGETLVLVTSEFGRTPKTNDSFGRDHWPRVFSTLIGGGGIIGGQVYGSSDALGAEVDEKPVSPEDLSATVFHLAGIDHQKHLMTNDQRPIQLSQGKVIKGLLS